MSENHSYDAITISEVKIAKTASLLYQKSLMGNDDSVN
jgi:hypothetical protein